MANRGTGVSSRWLDSQMTGGYRHELGLQAEKSLCERHRAPTRLAENLSRVAEVLVELWGRGGMCRSWWHILSNVHVPNACYVIISANPLYHVFTEPSFCSATSSRCLCTSYTFCYRVKVLLASQAPLHLRVVSHYFINVSSQFGSNSQSQCRGRGRAYRHHHRYIP